MLGAGAAAARTGPSLLALTRQNLPQLRLERSAENLCARGAYRLRAATAEREVVLIATGSEVQVALAVADALEGQGIGADVVSMPCWSLFDAQDAEPTAPTCCPATPCMVSIEAGTTLGWERYIGRDGLNIGLDRFGASAPAEDLFKRFGFTAEAIVPQHRCGAGISRRSMTWRPELRSTVSGGSAASSRAPCSSRQDSGLELVSINDLADAESNALLFKRDSVHGAYPGEVRADGNDLIVDGQPHPRHRRARPGQAAARAPTGSTSRSNAPASSPIATRPARISLPALRKS